MAWTTAALARLGFDYVCESTPRCNREVTVIRIRGGLSERLRFLIGTDPAITRKRAIDGAAVKSKRPLRVATVRPLGMVLRLYDITTGTGDFIANGVISHNCFARPTHTYLGFDAGRDFEREIVVKVNAPEVLRAELARPSWKREHVALGTNTDPYQWVEGRYRLMQGDLGGAARRGEPVLGADQVAAAAARPRRDARDRRAQPSFSACLSIPTLDEKAWRATEPHTPSPRARLEAVAELNRAGIPTGVLIAPLMPGINDAPHQVEPLLEAAERGRRDEHRRRRAAPARRGARGVHGLAANRQRPDLVPRYRGALPPRRLRAAARNASAWHAWSAAGHRPGQLRAR